MEKREHGYKDVERRNISRPQALGRNTSNFLTTRKMYVPTVFLEEEEINPNSYTWLCAAVD